MWLSMATHRDIGHFMAQDREYTGFQTNFTHLRGRGPTLLQTKRKRKRAEEIFIQQSKENIEQGNIEQDIPNDPEEIFVPIKEQGTGFQRHSLQQIQHKKKIKSTECAENNNTSQQNQKKNTNEGTKKKSVQKPKQQTANSEEEDSDIAQMSRVPCPKEEVKLNSNPLEIVFINGNITTCSGCNFKCKDSERREPYDLVSKIHMHHMRPLCRGTIWA